MVRPNFDTPYSAAFLDVGPEPVVMTLPKTDRYHVIQMMDGRSDVFGAPGTRMTGGQGGLVLIVDPRWQSEVPADMELVRSPTETVWVVGRIQTNGARDYPFVHELQKQPTLTPLGAWGKAYVPPRGKVDPALEYETPPRRGVELASGPPRRLN